MHHVTLPTPVAVTAGALCLLGGYLLGAFTAPTTPSRVVAEVESYDDADGRLCLSGDDIDSQPGAQESGRLCGTWRRSTGDRDLPEPGDEFRFISVVVDQPPRAEAEQSEGPVTMIYGNVVR